MTTERFSIVIDYLLDSGEERAVRLTPEEYFDLDENDDVAHLGVDFHTKTPRGATIPSREHPPEAITCQDRAILLPEMYGK